MGEITAIGWCDHTFNPWWGCSRVSPACRFCYADRDAVRSCHRSQGVSSIRPHRRARGSGSCGWSSKTSAIDAQNVLAGIPARSASDLVAEFDSTLRDYHRRAVE